MPCTEKKTGITSQISRMAPANKATCPRIGLIAIRTVRYDQKTGNPIRNSRPSQMSESKTLCLMDLQSECRSGFERHAGDPVKVDCANDPAQQDQQEDPAEDPDERTGVQAKRGSQRGLPGHLETQQAGEPHREGAQDDEQVELIAMLVQADWMVATSGKLEGNAFAMAGSWSMNGWRNCFKRRCGPSHRNRSSSSGGRMTAIWLATESNPATNEESRPGGGGNLPCEVLMDMDCF